MTLSNFTSEFIQGFWFDLKMQTIRREKKIRANDRTAFISVDEVVILDDLMEDDGSRKTCIHPAIWAQRRGLEGRDHLSGPVVVYRWQKRSKIRARFQLAQPLLQILFAQIFQHHSFASFLMTLPYLFANSLASCSKKRSFSEAVKSEKSIIFGCRWMNFRMKRFK
jgi:hypothetical protein